MATRFTKEEVLKLVKALTGEIQPVGETNEDNKRYENLKVLGDVVEALACEISEVDYKNAGMSQYSIKRAKTEASLIIKRIKESI